jgi:hypothetical protein
MGVTARRTGTVVGPQGIPGPQGPTGPQGLPGGLPKAALDLRTYVSTSRQSIIVDRYSSNGDGGGGTFVWNPTDVRADNGGTIFAVLGVSQGRWNRVYSGPLNIRWFGAKGDGRWTTATISNGSQSITVAGVTGADVGKLILVDAAGPSGTATLVGVLSATGTISVAASHSVTSARCFLASDDTTAILATIAAAYALGGGGVLVPLGMFGHQGITISVPGVYLRGLGDGGGNSGANANGVAVSELRHINVTGLPDAVFFDGGAYTSGPNLSAIQGCGLTDISIGGTSATNNCLRIRNCHHSYFGHYRTVDCAQAGTKTEFTIANVYDHPRHSSNENTPLAGARPTYGQHLGWTGSTGNSSTSSKTLCPVFEGTTNGYYEESGNSNAVECGTFEGCSGVGMILGPQSANGNYSNIDMEANGADVQCVSGSAGHKFDTIQATSGGAGGGIEFKSGCSNHTVISGDYTNVTVDTGALNVSLEGTISAGAFTNNGSGTKGSVHLPSGWVAALFPGGIAASFGAAITGGTTTDTLTATGASVLHATNVETDGPAFNAVTPRFKVSLASDQNYLVGMDFDTTDTTADSEGTPYIQATKNGSGYRKLRLQPGGVGIGIGPTTGTMSGLFTLLNQSVTGFVINPGTDFRSTITFTGVRVGDVIIATPRVALANGIHYYAYVSANDQITLAYIVSGSSQTIATTTFDFLAIRQS